MLGALAPVAVAPALVDLGIFALAIALILLRKAWVSTFGALLRHTASLFDAASLRLPVIHTRVGFNWVGDILRSVDHAALNLLGAGITATDHAAKTLWHWTAYLLEQSARVTAELAESTWGRIHHLERWALPAYVTQRLAGITAQVQTLTRQLEQLAAHPTTIVRPVTRLIDPRLGSLEREVDVLTKQVAAIAVGVPAPAIAIPHLPTGGILHGIDELRAKLGRITRVLTPAGAVGLVAAVALERLDLGWLKCRGVTRAGRELCGLGGLLEELASDTLEALIVADLCEFTAAIAYAARRFEPVLLGLVDVESALVGCRGATVAKPLRLARVSPTPVAQPLHLA